MGRRFAVVTIRLIEKLLRNGCCRLRLELEQELTNHYQLYRYMWE